MYDYNISHAVGNKSNLTIHPVGVWSNYWG